MEGMSAVRDHFIDDLKGYFDEQCLFVRRQLCQNAVLR